MIKAAAGNQLIFGLSRRNIERLLKGDPIRILGRNWNCDKDIFIFFGETEESMAKDISKFISPSTKVIDERPN
jgi:hypothetical protein